MKVKLINITNPDMGPIVTPAEVEGNALSMYAGIVWITGAELIKHGATEITEPCPTTDFSKGVLPHYLYGFKLGEQVEDTQEVREAFLLARTEGTMEA